MAAVDNFCTGFARASTVKGVRSRIASALAAALLAGALTVGCTPTPEPSPTPTGFATEEEAFAAAEETYRAYVDALNAVDLSDPETFEDVYAWTTGEANAGERKTFTDLHAKGLTVTGSSTAALVEPHGGFDADILALQLAVCLDVSNVDLTDEAGESVVSPNRGDVQSMLVTLVPGSTPTRLAISRFEGREGDPSCVGS